MRLNHPCHYDTGNFISIHAPIVGCDYTFNLNTVPLSAISIHAPIVGCDILGIRNINIFKNFNPRTHRGVRPHKCVLCHVVYAISIHAPIVGCDGTQKKQEKNTNNFNPRTHRGVRQSA